MLLELMLCCLVFVTTTLGLAWPLATRLPLAAPEKLVATAALSLLGLFLLTWIWFLSDLPRVWLWVAPAISVLNIVVGWRSLAALLRSDDVRPLWRGQLLVAAWCLGWLTLVSSYSGGGWTGDWFEHWERANFFLERGATDTVFIGHATVTARPPLVNVVTAAMLALTRGDFAHYQIFSTWFASLAFLPAALLARRFAHTPKTTSEINANVGGVTAPRERRNDDRTIRGVRAPRPQELQSPLTPGTDGDFRPDRTIALLTLLVMLSPLFVQNATFAWTKLPAAFFALTGVYFFLAALGHGRPVVFASLAAATLAAGILSHYSIGPYVVIFAFVWIVVSVNRRQESGWWRATAAAVGIGGAVLATWFAWAIVTFGAAGTLFANTSISTADTRAGGQLLRIGLNLWDTLVPYFLRPLDTALITQASPWGLWRDRFFQLYQTNLLFAFGLVGWIALVRLLGSAHQTATPPVRRAGWVLVGGTIVLGIAVHGARDTWGLVHICLQPVIMAGLAFLAAHAAALSQRWRRLLAVAVAVDLCLGIILHFAVQNFAFERWIGPESFAKWQENNSMGAVMNLAGKLQHKLVFLNDAWAVPAWGMAVFLAVVLAVAVRNLRGKEKANGT